MVPPTRCGHRVTPSGALGLAIAMAVGLALALFARWRSQRIGEAEAALGIGPHRAADVG